MKCSICRQLIHMRSVSHNMMHKHSFLIRSATRCSHNWSSTNIRNTFIDFFKQRDHTFVKSSSVIPDNDPSLLTVNAGMNQFKKIFLQQLPPSHPFKDLKRAVNSQKCIRCGGKHNDLEAVGRDFRHHTFFEMLGNWSFGDYGKEQAIHMSWELLTHVFKLDPSRLVITFFAGDQGLEADGESEAIWRSIIRDNCSSHNQPVLIGLGSEDNFWEMGSTGPCGPCTEIHYLIDTCNQRVQEAGHAPLDIMSKATEVWNLVFIQYNRMPDGSLNRLNKQHVDTGMGLERMASILQTESQSSNYDTDLFVPLFHKIQEQTGQRPYTGLLNDPIDVSYRIIADHVRMFTVAISDCLLPSESGAGLKVRSIIRSAHWEANKSFNLFKPTQLFGSLCDTVAEILGDAYPEIRANVPRVKDVVCEEVSYYHMKLLNCRKAFKAQARELKHENQKIMSGEQAFVLHKRFGCPLQLLQQLGHKYSIEIDFDHLHKILQEEHDHAVNSAPIKDSVK